MTDLQDPQPPAWRKKSKITGGRIVLVVVIIAIVVGVVVTCQRS